MSWDFVITKTITGLKKELDKFTEGGYLWLLARMVRDVLDNQKEKMGGFSPNYPVLNAPPCSSGTGHWA